MNDQINTSGGTSVGRDVNIGTGDFVGRDKVINQFSILSEDSFKILLSAIRAIHNSKSSSQQILFEQHIEPTFQKLEQVHKDYERTLFELSLKIKNRNGVRQIKQWLLARSRSFQFQRDYLKLIDKEFDILIVNPSENIDAEINKAIESFSYEVSQYFSYEDYINGSGPRISALTHLADLIELRVQLDGLSFNIFTIMARRKLVLKIQNELNQIISQRLPEKWRKVCAAYLRLRGLCLS